MSAKDSAAQIDLFEHLLDAYAQAPAALSNEALYRSIGQRAGIDDAAWQARQPIGRAGQQHSPFKRRVRWQQQTLRSLGLLERDEAAGRGHWQLTNLAREAPAFRPGRDSAATVRSPASAPQLETRWAVA